MRIFTFWMTAFASGSIAGAAVAQSVTTAYTFADPVDPQGGLLFQRGMFFGASLTGGDFALKPPAAAGGSWTYTIYGSASYAANPASGVAVDPAGVLYAAQSEGGAYPGVIVAETPSTATGSGTTTVLYTSPPYPAVTTMYGPLIRDSTGVLYGTFEGWTTGEGVVYSLSPPQPGQTSWSFKALHIFSGPDGSGPLSGVIRRNDGTLLGTTLSGGKFNGGTVFALQPPSTPAGAWTETVLYSFAGGANGADGYDPIGGVTADQSGAIYGTTSRGGSSEGTVYRLTAPPNGKGAYSETVLTGSIYMPFYAPTITASGTIYAVGSDSKAAILTPDAEQPGQYTTVLAQAPYFTSSGITFAGSYAVGTSGCEGCTPSGSLWYLPIP